MIRRLSKNVFIKEYDFTGSKKDKTDNTWQNTNCFDTKNKCVSDEAGEYVEFEEILDKK